MKTDLVKMLYTYTIATILIVGGLVFLYQTRLDPPEAATGILIPLVAGFVGAAVQFVFGQESATRAARMTERTFAAAQPTTTVSAGPPATTTISPQPPEDHP